MDESITRFIGHQINYFKTDESELLSHKADKSIRAKDKINMLKAKNMEYHK